MTPEQAWTRVRRIAFELERADYGMGMPRDYRRVLELRAALEQARKDAAAAEAAANDNTRNDGYDILSDGFEELQP
jgi:hypothetical protein